MGVIRVDLVEARDAIALRARVELAEAARGAPAEGIGAGIIRPLPVARDGIQGTIGPRQKGQATGSIAGDVMEGSWAASASDRGVAGRPAAGAGGSAKAGPDPSAAEEVESALERAEADELVALEVLLAEAVLDHLAVELFHAADQVILEAEVGQEPGELVEVDPVVPRVGADLAGVDDLGGGDQPLDLVADVADLVVLAIAADVDRPGRGWRPGAPGRMPRTPGRCRGSGSAAARASRRTGCGSRRRTWPRPAGC